MKRGIDIAILLALVFFAGGCSFSVGESEDKFSTEFACPIDRVEARPRVDLRPPEKISQEPAPPDVAADPERLKLWQSAHTHVDSDSYDDFIEVRGCEQQMIYRCHDFGGGRYGGLSCKSVSTNDGTKPTSPPAWQRPAFSGLAGLAFLFSSALALLALLFLSAPLRISMLDDVPAFVARIRRRIHAETFTSAEDFAGVDPAFVDSAAGSLVLRALSEVQEDPTEEPAQIGYRTTPPAAIPRGERARAAMEQTASALYFRTMPGITLGWTLTAVSLALGYRTASTSNDWWILIGLISGALVLLSLCFAFLALRLRRDIRLVIREISAAW